jgi:hypothetical protein
MHVAVACILHKDKHAEIYRHYQSSVTSQSYQLLDFLYSH